MAASSSSAERPALALSEQQIALIVKKRKRDIELSAGEVESVETAKACAAAESFKIKLKISNCSVDLAPSEGSCSIEIVYDNDLPTQIAVDCHEPPLLADIPGASMRKRPNRSHLNWVKDGPNDLTEVLKWDNFVRNCGILFI